MRVQASYPGLSLLPHVFNTIFAPRVWGYRRMIQSLYGARGKGEFSDRTGYPVNSACFLLIS